MKQPKKHRLAKLALLFISTLLGLVIAEVILRVAKPLQLAITQRPCIFMRDEETGYRYKPNAIGRERRVFEKDNIVRTNSIGFHDIEHESLTDDDAVRILALGDSFTAVLDVPISKGWPQTLQRELRKRGHPTADVVNLGLTGTGTDAHLAILKRYLPLLRPNMVILAFFRNDVEDLLMKRKFKECYKGYVLTYQDEEERKRLRDFVDKHTPPPFASWLFNNLYLFRACTFLSRGGLLLRTNYLTPLIFGDRAQKADNPPDIDDLLLEFTALSQQYDFNLLVIPVPAKGEITGSLDKLRDNASESTLSRLDIVDVSPIVKRLTSEEGKSYSELFWVHDGHFNLRGNRIFGSAIAEAVDSRLREQSR